MLEFAGANIAILIADIRNRDEVEFLVLKQHTAFDGQSVPSGYTSYPPASLPDHMYGQALAMFDTDVRGTFNSITLEAHLLGGDVQYRAHGEHHVAVRVLWDNQLT